MQSRFLMPPFAGRPAAVCLALIFFAMLMARAPFLFYIGMSTDAYNNGLDLPPYDFLASQGRQGSYVMIRLLSGLGIYGPHLQFLNVALGIAALSVASFYLFRTVFPHSRLAIFTGSLLFLAHPYQSEIITFRDAFPFYAVATMAGCCGYYLTGSVDRRRLLSGTFLIVAGLTIYQSFVNFLAMAWLLQAVLVMLLPAYRERDPNWQRRLMQRAGSVTAAMAIYLVLIKALNHLQGTAVAGRATLISIEEIPERAGAVLLVFKQLIRVDLIASAPLASALIAMLVLSALILMLVRGEGYWRFVAVPAFAVLLLFFSVGLISVGKDFWPMPRTLVAAALIPAFAACILLELARSALFFRSIAITSSIILVAYVGLGTRVAVDQVRINQRDALFAATIAARVPLPPGIHLAIVGGPNNALGLSTVRGDMNISAYWAHWSKVEAVSEYLGYRIANPTEQQWDMSRAYCASPDVETWPGETSVSTIGDGHVTICLSKP